MVWLEKDKPCTSVKQTTMKDFIVSALARQNNLRGMIKVFI